MNLDVRNLPEIYDDSLNDDIYNFITTGMDKLGTEKPSVNDEHSEDIILIEKIANGDELAFANLVNKYSGRLYTTAYRILSDSHEAEDILQQVFTIIWQKAHRWQPKGRGLAAWLKRVTINKSIDHNRKFMLVSNDIEFEIADKSPMPDQVLEENQLSAKIEDALNALPIRHKTAIILSYFEGYKNSDSAELLGLNIKAMESLLHRARKNFRDLLTQNGIANLDFEV